MAQETIGIGASADDGTGDDLRTAGGKINANFTELYASAAAAVSSLALKAPLASPVFTGNPEAPTQSPGDSSTRLATTAFVAEAIVALSLGTMSQAAAADYYTANQSDVITDALASAIAGKADSVHSHAISDVTGLQAALDGKAASVHSHAIADVTGLQAEIDGKQASDATLTSLAAVSGVAGDILYASGADAWARLAKGTDGQYLVLASGVPSWATFSGGATLGANTFTALQTITQASANAGILASTGYSLTGSNATSMIDLAGIWNTTGKPSAIKLNVTNTASANPAIADMGSLLLNLQVGGTSVFVVRRDGGVGFLSGNAWFAKAATVDGNGAWVWGLPSNTETRVALGTNRLGLGSQVLGWTASVDATAALDTIIRRMAAASIAFGAADAASPVAQTLGVQSVVAGTSNAAGALWSLDGSQGTGTGAGGAIRFRTAPAGSSGSTQNPLVEAFRATINATFGLPDGIAEPATIAGIAQIYVDTADGDLKVKYGDGTVKLIVADT